MIYALETLVKSCTSWNEQQKNQVLAWLNCAKDFGSDNDVLTKENEQLKKQLVEAMEIISKLLKDIKIAENEYKFTSQSAIKAERFLKESR